jgi:arsenate reductase
MKWTIYHNPKCRKSREALELLRMNNIDPEVVRYLDLPPDAATLKKLLAYLGINAIDLVRKEEALYKEEFKGKVLSELEWVAVLDRFPLLIQRPIIVHGTRAIIGRPPELVLSLMDQNE